jgi:hypothetical protein
MYAKSEDASYGTGHGIFDEVPGTTKKIVAEE